MILIILLKLRRGPFSVRPHPPVCDTRPERARSTLERPKPGAGGSQMDPLIGFSDLKFEAFKQSK